MLKCKSSFLKKFGSMDTSALIQTMVDGLKDPCTIVDMGTYGRYNFTKKQCIGCASTNALCKINERPFEFDEISSRQKRALTLEVNWHLVWCIESFYDGLRRGEIEMANHFLHILNEGYMTKKFKSIEVPAGLELPRLDNNYTEEELKLYENLAIYNKQLDEEVINPEWIIFPQGL